MDDVKIYYKQGQLGEPAQKKKADFIQQVLELSGKAKLLHTD